MHKNVGVGGTNYTGPVQIVTVSTTASSPLLLLRPPVATTAPGLTQLWCNYLNPASTPDVVVGPRIKRPPVS